MQSGRMQHDRWGAVLISADDGPASQMTKLLAGQRLPSGGCHPDVASAPGVEWLGGLMMPRFRPYRLVVTAGAILAAASAPPGALAFESAKEYVELYKASVQSIQSIQCKMRVVSERNFPETLHGLRRDSAGQVIVVEAKRVWDVATGRERLEGEALRIIKGVVYYEPIVSAYDGDKYRAYNPDPETWGHLGGIIEPFQNQPRTFYYWVPELIGYRFDDGPERHLWELLDEAVLVSPRPKEVPEHVVVLETTYKIFDRNETRLRVWLDSKHGFLPTYVEGTRIWSNTLVTQIRVDDFADPSPGIWIPIKGFDRRFAIDMVLPEGLTKADVGKLVPEELIARGARYVGHPLGYDGYYPDVVFIDPQSLVVNELFDPKTFAVEFPPKLNVFDAFRVNTSDIAARESAPSRSSSSGQTFRVLLVVNVILACIIGFLYMRSRRRRADSPSGAGP